MTDKEKFRKEVEKLKSNLIYGACSSQIAMETMCKEEAYNEVLAILDTMQEEPVSEDLGEHINELSKQFPEVSFAKLSRIAVRVSRWQQNQDVKNKLPKVTNRTDLDGYAYQCAYDISNDWAIENPTWKDVEDACKLGAKWKVENLWKPADGDDLPILDREVIALLDNGKVVFAHRPPEYWDGKDIVTGKVTRHYPKTYDKGGWNIPNIKYWLDCLLPNMEED